MYDNYTYLMHTVPTSNYTEVVSGKAGGREFVYGRCYTIDSNNIIVMEIDIGKKDYKVRAIHKVRDLKNNEQWNRVQYLERPLNKTDSGDMEFYTRGAWRQEMMRHIYWGPVQGTYYGKMEDML